MLKSDIRSEKCVVVEVGLPKGVLEASVEEEGVPSGLTSVASVSQEPEEWSSQGFSQS